METSKFLCIPLLSLQLITILSIPFFLVLPCLGNDQLINFVSCLTHHNINNFTTCNEVNYHNLLYFSLQNLRYAGPSTPKPKAIVVPSTKEQLADSVVCCRSASFEIRVRCGGHSYEGTSSVSTDGSPFVIIDMMNLNKISIDVQQGVARVEGGATLGQTYLEIAKSSKLLGFPARMCPTVGVGGHIAGGGFSLMSRKHGLAADHVVDALLVNAEGQVLNREVMGDDVFWAIRGGGGGMWGIIYAYKIKLVTVPEVVTGFIVSRSGSKNHIATLVDRWQFVAPKLEEEFYLSAYVGADLPEADGEGVSVTFKGFYLGLGKNVVSILKNVFPDLGVILEDCVEMSWIESILYFSGLEKGSTVSDLGNRYLGEKGYFKAKFDYVRSHIPFEGIEAMLDILEKQPKGFLFLEPYGGIMEEIPSGSIAFPHRKGNIFTMQYLINWNEEENGKSEEYMEWISGLYGKMTPYVSSNPRASYVNYMDLDLGVMVSDSVGSEVEMARVWGEKYFLENYDRLVKAKTLIDPHNIFKNQQGIPPLPSKEMTYQTFVSKMK